MKIINTITPSIFKSDGSIAHYWNSDLIRKIYIDSKGVTISDSLYALEDPVFKEKVNNIKLLIENNDIVTICNDMINSFEQDTGYSSDEMDLYIIVGCETTTIYSISLDGHDVSILCLEEINGNIDNLNMLLAHEYTHYVRKSILQKDIFESCIGERLVTEGIAENYAREAVLGRKDSTYCLVDDETVTWVRQNLDEVERRVRGGLFGRDLMSDLFYMYAEVDYPVRSGYVYGFYAVKQYLEENNLHVKDIIGIDWKTILK